VVAANRIFEVANDKVSFAGFRALEPVWSISWHEEQRASRLYTRGSSASAIGLRAHLEAPPHARGTCARGPAIESCAVRADRLITCTTERSLEGDLAQVTSFTASCGRSRLRADIPAIIRPTSVRNLCRLSLDRFPGHLTTPKRQPPRRGYRPGIPDTRRM